MHKIKLSIKAKNRGFTVVELAIVLVILGLIAFGTLVGNDLVKSAEIRATISQIEGIQSSVKSFKAKYKALPGDMHYLSALEFGLATGDGSAGRGDGNGILTGMNGGDSYQNAKQQSGENTLFWHQLSAAGYLEGNFSAATIAPVSGINIGSYYPKAKLGTAYFLVFSRDGINYLALSGVSTLGEDLTTSYGLTPSQAYAIDKKIDNGNPVTGLVLADDSATIGSNEAGLGSGLTSNNICADASIEGSEVYLITNNKLSCNLHIRLE